MKKTYILAGLDCPHCSAEIEKDVWKIKGVTSSNVNLVSQTLTVELDGSYRGDIYKDIEEGKKSMAYSLTFKDETRTLSDEEVMEVFNKIISEVETKLNAKLRSM